VQRDFANCGRGGNCITPDIATWDPEIAFNYEIGVKSEWLDNRLRLNGALFYTQFEDFQVLQNVPAEVSVLVSNAAEVEAQGLELEFTGILTDNFMVNGSASFIQSEYADYQGAPCAYSTQAGCVGGLQDLSGETLDHAPEISFSLGGEYRQGLTMVNGAELFARLDVVYSGEQNLYVLLPEDTEQDAYAVLNGRIGLEAVDQWKVTLWGKNLADEDYLTAADTAGDGGLSQIPALPRTYGMTVDWFF
jgi:iron complex outermembrane receptor protein